MKIQNYLVMGVAAVALMGCKPDSTQDVQSMTNSAVNSITQTKDEFLAASRKKMDELDARIKQLSDKSGDYKDDAKVQSDKTLAALRDQRSKLGVQYDKLKDASADAWDKTKSAFSAAWDDMEKAYDDAKAKFK